MSAKLNYRNGNLSVMLEFTKYITFATKDVPQCNLLELISSSTLM